jgi:ParB family protein of integrating conjugative element (PFGI_1 class)
MSFLRTPITLTASDRLAQRVQEGKIVRDGTPDAEKPPTDGQRLTLPSLSIKPYDRNPRRSLNPLYPEIKESVQARGGLVFGVLTVTRRPGSSDYMIYGGGNTRLQVVQDLARAYPDDPRFSELIVVYREWRGELDVMASHFIENEIRADTTFWDKACGLAAFSATIKDETGVAPAPAELRQRAADLGWKLSRDMVQIYGFATANLGPIGEWLTFAAVRVLMERINALSALVVRLDVRTGAERFAALLDDELAVQESGLPKTARINASESKQGGADPVLIAAALEERVATEIGVSMADLRRMLDLLAASEDASDSDDALRALAQGAVPASRPKPPERRPASEDAMAQIPLPTSMLAAVRSSPLPDPFEDQEAGLRAGLPSLESQGEVPAELVPRHVPDAAVVPPAEGEPPRPSPEAVRAAHDLRDALCQLAGHTSNAELFRLAPHMPLGYLMEPPDRPMLAAGPLPPEIVLQRAGWQLLATLSTQFDRRCEYALPTESRWCEAVRADGIGPLLERCGVTVNGDRIELDAECLFVVLTEPKQLSPTVLRVLSALAVRRSTLARVLPTRLELITSPQAGAG